MIHNKDCGAGDLIVISRFLADSIDKCYSVTRWCSKCGGVVVDGEVDGRVIPGYYRKMIFPKLVNQGRT